MRFLVLLWLLGVAAAQQLTPLTTDLTRPVFAAPAPGVPDRLYVAQLDGQIHIVALDPEGARVLPVAFLDLAGRVTALEGEQGFYGFAFHPEFAGNGRLFAIYTEFGTGDVVVTEHRARSPDAADPTPVLELLRVPVQDPFHHGGALAFGPDGYLYASFGDGSFTGAHLREPPLAQDLGDLRGKLVRLDVDGGEPYAVPPDNPFVGMPGARPELYAYGFRNPWKLSFDRETGDLWLADVGNDRWEEVNVVVAGGNYGWPYVEGIECTLDPDLYTLLDPDCPAGYLPPATAYAHLHLDPEGGNAVTGGFVYRGQALPDLFGRYVFADFVSGRIWSVGAAQPGNPELLLETPHAVSGFAEDAADELYVLTIAGGLYALAAE